MKKWYLAALVVVIFWGTTFISTKILLADLSPLQIMLSRYLIGYLALLLLHPKFHRSEGRKVELHCLILAIFGSTLYFWAENTALSYTQASNVSLLVSCAPILTAVAAHLFTRERSLTTARIHGFIAAFIGIFLVVCNGRLYLKLSPAGDLLAILAAASWAVYTVLLRKLRSKYPPIYITRRIFLYSIFTMLPLQLLDGPLPSLSVYRKPQVWGNLLFLGLVASAFCYVLWYHVVAHIGPVSANNFVYLNPLTTMAVSSVILHEKITWMMLLGAALILLGVILADGTLKRRLSHPV